MVSRAGSRKMLAVRNEPREQLDDIVDVMLEGHGGRDSISPEDEHFSENKTFHE